MKKAFALLIVVLALPIGGFGGFGQGVGLIRGRVIDGLTGLGVDGVTVRLESILTYGGRNTRTSNGGAFFFENLAPIKYTVLAEFDGYELKSTVDADLSSVVSKEITLYLRSRSAIGSVSGRVLDTDDKPVAKATVCVQRRHFDDFGDVAVSSQGSVCATTDADGRYATNKVEPGAYVVEVINDGSGGRLATFHPREDELRYATPIEVEGSPVSNVDIRIKNQPPMTIRGEVAIPIPLPSDVTVMITVYINDRALFKTAADYVPDSNRRTFKFSGLASGNYRLEAEVVGQAARTGLSGWARVILRSEDVDNVLIPLDFSIGLQFVVLRPGEELDPSWLQSASAITVPPGTRYVITTQTYRMEAVVGPTGKIFATPTSPQLLKPSLLCRSGASTVRRDAQRFTDRAYTMTAWAARDCLLEVENVVAGHYVESAKFDGNDVWDRVFTPTAAMSNLVIRLADGAGVVAGKVVDERDQNYTGPTTVVLVPANPPGDHPSAEIRFRTNVTGSFEIGNIRPGAYRLFAFPDAGESEHYNNMSLIRENEARSTYVEIKKGERKTLNPALIRIP